MAHGRNNPGANIASTMTTIAGKTKFHRSSKYATSNKMIVIARPASRHWVIVSGDGASCMGTFYLYEPELSGEAIAS